MDNKWMSSTAGPSCPICGKPCQWEDFKEIDGVNVKPDNLFSQMFFKDPAGLL